MAKGDAVSGAAGGMMGMSGGSPKQFQPNFKMGGMQNNSGMSDQGMSSGAPLPFGHSNPSFRPQLDNQPNLGQPDYQKEGVQSAYKSLLGRDMGENEYGNWSGNNNYWNEIANSPEALARQPYWKGVNMGQMHMMGGGNAQSGGNGMSNGPVTNGPMQQIGMGAGPMGNMMNQYNPMQDAVLSGASHYPQQQPQINQNLLMALLGGGFQRQLM